MTRYNKNLLIWALFGVMWGKLIARAIVDYTTISGFDWVLIVVGSIVAIIHYLPDRKEIVEETEEQEA